MLHNCVASGSRNEALEGILVFVVVVVPSIQNKNLEGALVFALVVVPSNENEVFYEEGELVKVFESVWEAHRSQQ